jgi:hypothetical protein
MFWPRRNVGGLLKMSDASTLYRAFETTFVAHVERARPK